MIQGWTVNPWWFIHKMYFKFHNPVTLTEITLAKVLLNWNTLKHLSNFWSGQSLLDYDRLLTSTWLYPATFLTSWIRNSSSPAPKHSELLASHCCSLRSEEHLCPYPIGITLNSRVIQNGHIRCESYSTCMPY